MELYVCANHMLVLYCVLYAIGNLLRAVMFESDQSDDAVGVSIVFFVLSIWLVINSLVYYKAFVEEMAEAEAAAERVGPASPSMRSMARGPAIHMEGSGVIITLSQAAANGAVGGHTASDADITLDGLENARTTTSAGGPIKRSWTYYLMTEAGIAYALNIVGSVGYVVSSLISLLLTVSSIGTARQVDRAALYLDTVNMFVFIVDALLFFHVWWQENPARTLRGKMRSVYFWANVYNTLNSVAYFVFIVWSLRQRYRLAEEEAQHVAAGDKHWYDEQLIQVTFDQRTMYFCGDIMYLVYALLLEVGWRIEHTNAEGTDNARALPAMQMQKLTTAK